MDARPLLGGLDAMDCLIAKGWPAVGVVTAAFDGRLDGEACALDVLDPLEDPEDIGTAGAALSGSWNIGTWIESIVASSSSADSAPLIPVSLSLYPFPLLA
jgi:hypothetical protein